MDQVRLDTHQLCQFFDRIHLPEKHRVLDASVLSDYEKLEYLKRLQKHYLCGIPWENLTQHYSWHRTVNVSPQHLFHKIVASTQARGSPGPGSHGTNRGGYCMEVNFFQHVVLLSLRFDTYIVGSRICTNGSYGGWTHCVNIVCIGGQKYLLDGGYGSRGPTFPVPLQHEVSFQHVRSGGTAEGRLLYTHIAEHVNPDSRVWVYQFRSSHEQDWTAAYCFVDVEFIPADIQAMNFAPWLNPQSFFAHKVVCVRFTTTAEQDSPHAPYEEAFADEAQIDGAVIIADSIFKWRRNGVTVVKKKLKTEAERVEVLRSYFGIQLPVQDVEAIRGTAAEIGVGGLSM